MSELEIQSLRESDSKKKKKKHQDKKKKKKHIHREDTLTSGDSPGSDTDNESDDGKSRDGYSSPDTGKLFLQITIVINLYCYILLKSVHNVN